MKKRVFIFVFTALLALTIAPAINLALGNIPSKKGSGWWNIAVLYNVDFAQPYMNRIFYRFGISRNPAQVIIGKNDWLYLGDMYESTITVRRRSATTADIETSKKIGLASKSWNEWLEHRGVRLYRVMLAPDKESIYPEFLPDWAQPAADSVTNTLLANTPEGLYIDTRPALTAAKSQFSEPLYYQTGTHWNGFGAWVAFRAFATAIAQTDRSLNWLTNQQVHISKVNELTGNDLADFLWMGPILRDNDVVMEIASAKPIQTEQYDFETGRLIAAGGNSPIGAPQRPLLVKSKNALNQKRVLWLRDSFGTAMAPYMAATFTETLQLHFDAVKSDQFAQLVDAYKPDYVFITVVERSARSAWFTNPSPTIFPSMKRENYASLSYGHQSGVNDMTKIEGAYTYRISGADPFFTFSLSSPIQPQDAPKLSFNLNCGERKAPVQIQVFWRTARTAFSEAISAHFFASPGITAIDLSPLSLWTQSEAITDLRIDLDSPADCPIVTIKNVELGK